MALDPTVLRARIALRIARLELDALLLAREIAAERAQASTQARSRRAAWIARQMLLRAKRMQPPASPRLKS
jgi:hypothetical protein